MPLNLVVTRMSRKGKAAFSSVSVVNFVFGRYHLIVTEILLKSLSMWPYNKGVIYIVILAYL